MRISDYIDEVNRLYRINCGQNLKKLDVGILTFCDLLNELKYSITSFQFAHKGILVKYDPLIIDGITFYWDDPLHPYSHVDHWDISNGKVSPKDVFDDYLAISSGKSSPPVAGTPTVSTATGNTKLATIKVMANSGPVILPIYPFAFERHDPTKVAIAELPPGCSHSWKTYVGFTDSFDYCTSCNEKRKDA